MKSTIKRALAILLAVVMTVGSAPLSGLAGLGLPKWNALENIFKVEAEAASDTYEINYYVDGVWMHKDTYKAGENVTAWTYTPIEGLTFSGWGNQVPSTMPSSNIEVHGATEVLSYTVTFTVNGEVYAISSAAFGSVVVSPEFDIPEGYSFTGWDLPATMPAQNITLDASLTINSYWARWYLDDEKTILYHEELVEFGAEIPFPEDPTEDDIPGQAFDIWDYDTVTTMVVGGIDYVAITTPIEYTVEFYSDDGSYIDGWIAYYGDDITIYDVPVLEKEGFEFKGWFVDGEIVTFPLTVTNDVTFTAMFISNEVSGNSAEIYTDFYVQDVGGNWIKTNKVSAGVKVKVAVSVVTDYRVGSPTLFWVYSKDFMTFDTSNLTLIQKKDTGYYYDAAGVFNPSVTSIPTANGWSGMIVHSEDVIEYSIADDLCYEGYFASDADDPYLSCFEYFDDKGWIALTCNEGTPAKLNKNEHMFEFYFIVKDSPTTYEGFFFVPEEGIMTPVQDCGFTALQRSESTTDFGVNVNDAAFMVDYNIQLNDNSAIVFSTETSTTYTQNVYTMDTTGAYGSAVTTTHIAEIGESINAADYTVPKGFSLDKDKSTLSVSIVADGLSVMNIYLSRNRYTVAFDGVETQRYYGETIAEPTVTPTTGYELDKWVDGEGNEIASWPVTIGTEDVTIIPVYKKILRTITYVYAGAVPAGFTAPAAVTGVIGDTVIVPVVPTAEGYTASAWVVEGADADGKVYTSDVTVTTTWTINKFTVTFYTDKEGDLVHEIKEYVYGETVTAPDEEPTKAGYTFGGWTPDIPETMPAKNVEFTAQWFINGYHITYYVDGVKYDSTYFEYGSYIDVVTPPIKEGYVFGGWKDNNGNDFVFPETMPAHTIEVYASWIEEDVELVGGSCGENLTWTFNESTGMLTISGTGYMDYWETEDKVPWHAFRSNIKNVNITNGVTGIGFFAFYCCNNLSNITMSDGIMSISDYAFYNCDNLTNVILPNSLRYIEEYAFGDCDGITNVIIPDNVIWIEDNAFYNCSGLGTILIGRSVRYIGDGVFNLCLNLTDIMVNFENTAYSSDEYGVLFDKEKTILIQYPVGSARTSYAIPNSVATIGSYSFVYCTNLTTVTIPGSVTSIGEGAFGACSKLTSITISDNVVDIGEYAFYQTGVYYEPSNWENGILYIGNHLIEVDSKISGECTIKNGTKTISNYAFRYCANLTSVIIPEGATSIGYRAFYDCNNLSSVIIPDSITSIDVDAFNQTRIYTEQSNWENGVLYIGNHLIKAVNTLSGEYTIKSGTKTIAGYAFGHCDNLKSIKIPDSVKSIGNDAFYNCTKLTNIIIPDSVTVIGNTSFAYCESLTSIKIGSGVKSIGDRAFECCKSLACIIIPDSVTSIGEETFYRCSNLANVTIGDSVTSIGDYAFYDCDSLTNIIIPDSIKDLSDFIFADCDNLTSATIGNGITSIGYLAFACYKFSDIFYVGTEKHWSSISISEGNGCLLNATIHYNYGSTHEHSYNTFVIEPTCTDKGYTIYTCNECKETYTDDYVDAKGHDLTHHTVESTCTVQGCEFDICSSCNQTLNKVMLPLIDHEYTHKSAESTCTVQGYEEDYCSKCKKAYNHIDLPLKEHELEHVKVESTCTAEGCEYDICAVCKNEFDRIIIPMKPHELEHTKVDSTCTVEGYEYDICSFCKKKFEYVEIPVKNHILEHITIDSTCTNEGYEYNKCSVCKNEFDYAVIPQKQHNLEHIIVNATCTIEGYEYDACIVCKNEFSRVTIPLKEHDYDSTVIDATCTAEGYTLWECKNCNHIHKDSYTDALGHDFSEWQTVIEATCTENGKKHRICSRCNHEESETVNAHGHRWSEWTVDKPATVLADGVMSKTCSVCEEKEEQSIDRVQIDIEANKCYGLANFTVVNAQTKEPIEGASIFIATEKDGENTFNTDANGKVSVVLPVGELVVSAYAEGCITRNLKITVNPGENDIPVIGLSDKETYDVKLTSKEMSYEEIVEAGIDIANPSNSHVFKYELKLEFEPEIDWASLFFYMNVDGDIIGSQSPSNDNTENGGDGTGRSWTWIPPEDNNKGHFVIEPKEKGEDKIVVYPVSEYMYLIIRGEITWLKEMFDVEMLVINNSQTDTLENLTCTLELPDGLSLAAMIEEPQSLIQTIEHISEGESKSVHWYVRGDEEGSYDLKAKLEGTIMPFEEEINEEFVTENAIQVWAGSALNLHIEIPDAAYYGIDYPIRITLTNVSNKSLYNVCHLIRNVEQSKVVHYSNGEIVNETYMDEDFVGHEYVKEFKPGDKIVMEISVNILFESELIEYELQKIVGLIDGIEGLLEAYKGIKAAFDALSALDKCISGCEKALDKFLKSTSYLPEAKLDLARDLYKSISKLLRKYTSSGNKALDCAAKIGDSTIILILDAFASNPEIFLEEHSYDDIKALIKDVEALGNLFDSEDEKALKKFDIFDAIRTAIESLPVVFALKNVVLSEDASNTTSIPWSYSTVDTGAQYFGVSNVSSYYGNLMKAIMAEVWNEAAPSYLKLIPGFDDPLNYNDVKREIIAVENEIAEFKAKDATGEITFKAWVERNENTTTFSSKAIQSETFELSCDNATSVFKNGVLTFTGDGTISVVPTSTDGGVLVIEDSEGNRYEYSITVVEQHNCVAGENEIIINPTSKYDGFSVKRCTVCKDVVDIEILSVSGCVEHSFSEWKIECEATCSASGIKSHECLLCGFCEIDYSESVMHNPGEWTTITATETEAEKQVRYCTVCGKIAEEKYSDYIAVESVSVNLSAIELVNGQSGNLSATVLPNNASNRNVEWRSSDRNVVVVSNVGTITAVSPGTATVTVTTEDGNFNSSCEVTVLPREFNVTWIVDDVENVKTEYEYAAITTPSDPEKAGYTFVGWTPSVPEIMPSENLTFTAVFEANSYDAVFDANGGAWSDGATEKTITVKFGEEISAPEAPKKQGYVFSRWTPEIGVMDSTDGKAFTAEWIPATDTRYTVETYTMNTEGEYEKSSQVFSGTTDSTVSVEAKEKTGFTFNNENSVTEGTVKADNSLVLKVYYDRNKYAFTTVTDGVSSTENYYYGTTIVTPASPEKQGYRFIKWEGEIPETMPAESVTITAVFEKSYICPDCGKEILGEAAINEHVAAEARMKATIEIKNNNGSNTIKYGETLRLTAITTDMPADVIVCWYVDGEKKGEGETFDLSFESGTKTVEVKLVDAKGNVLKNASGNEIKDTETVTVKAGFFQKLIAFFKKLFGISQTVVQSIYF